MTDTKIKFFHSTISINYGFYWLVQDTFMGTYYVAVIDDQGSLVETSIDALVYFFFS